MNAVNLRSEKLIRSHLEDSIANIYKICGSEDIETSWLMREVCRSDLTVNLYRELTSVGCVDAVVYL